MYRISSRTSSLVGYGTIIDPDNATTRAGVRTSTSQGYHSLASSKSILRTSPHPPGGGYTLGMSRFVSLRHTLDLPVYDA